MTKLIKTLNISIAVIIVLLAVGVLGTDRLSYLTKAELLLFLIALALSSIGTFTSWKYIKTIDKYRNRAKLFVYLHAFSYILIVHLALIAILPVEINNGYYVLYVDKIAFILVLLSNAIPTFYLRIIFDKNFVRKGRRFIKKQEEN